MKSFFAFCFVALVLADAKDNLVENPGFEKVKDKAPEIWKQSATSDGGKATMTISKSMPKSGEYCLNLVGNAEWACVVSNRIAIEKGKTYLLSGFVRGKKGSGYIKFDYFKDTEYLGMTMPESRGESNWTEMKLESEIGSYPTATHISATLVGGEGEFEIEFDDIKIVKK